MTTTWDRVIAFGERCHRYCTLLCLAEAAVFVIILLWLVLR